MTSNASMAEAECPLSPSCDYCAKLFMGKNVCSSCRCVSYCSRGCQKKHWNVIHKDECETMTQQCASSAKDFVGVVTNPERPITERLASPLWTALDGS